MNSKAIITDAAGLQFSLTLKPDALGKPWGRFAADYIDWLRSHSKADEPLCNPYDQQATALFQDFVYDNIRYEFLPDRKYPLEDLEKAVGRKAIEDALRNYDDFGDPRPSRDSFEYREIVENELDVLLEDAFNYATESTSDVATRFKEEDWMEQVFNDLIDEYISEHGSYGDEPKRYAQKQMSRYRRYSRVELLNDFVTKYDFLSDAELKANRKTVDRLVSVWLMNNGY